MKFKKFTIYITLVITAVLLYSLFSYYSLEFLRGKTGSTEAFLVNIYYNIYQVLYGLLLGVLISIPYLYAQIKKAGSWHFNWYFFASTIIISIAIGLFLFEQNKFRFYYGIFSSQGGIESLEGFAHFDHYIRQLFLPTFTLLGYSVLGSLYKK